MSGAGRDHTGAIVSDAGGLRRSPASAVAAVSDPVGERPDGPVGPRLVTAELPLPAVAPDEVPALLEALLLVAPGPGPVAVADLVQSTGLSERTVEDGLVAVAGRFGDASGVMLQRHADTVTLVSAPRFAAHVRRFLRLDRETKLSTAALETLAIIAYEQPVTRSGVDAVRGVDSSGVLATLHGRGLIEQVGRLQAPGSPVQYGTTALFLRHFGLRALADLPPLGQVDGRDAREALTEAASAVADLPEIAGTSDDGPAPGRAGDPDSRTDGDGLRSVEPIPDDPDDPDHRTAR